MNNMELKVVKFEKGGLRKHYYLLLVVLLYLVVSNYYNYKTNTNTTKQLKDVEVLKT